MDCKTARLLIGFRPDAGELEGPDVEDLEAHLGDCLECGRIAQADRQFDARATRAMRQVPVPEDLESRLLARLKVDRGDRARRWVGRGLRAGLAAAAMILVGLLVYSYLQKPPPDLNVEQVFNDVLVRYNVPNKQQIEEWFAATHHVNMVAPTEFNYACVVHYDMAELAGKRVPLLVFVSSTGAVTARVFVVTNKDFSLGNLANDPTFSSNDITVTVWHKPGSEFAYVIIYSGEKLDPVLAPEQKAAA